MPTRTTHDSDDDMDDSSPVDVPSPTTGSIHNNDRATWHNDDPDTCRILLSTDNHLGYAERDSIRGMDSFAAFEEVLYLGQRYNVDLILLAGDVFHENRPSRRTIYKTMEIVRRYCMGPNPIRIQIISDPNSLKASLRSSCVNYLDPNYSVHLPIFAIHGNHDDPSRDQGGGELLAALGTFLHAFFLFHSLDECLTLSVPSYRYLTKFLCLLLTLFFVGRPTILLHHRHRRRFIRDYKSSQLLWSTRRGGSNQNIANLISERHNESGIIRTR